MDRVIYGIALAVVTLLRALPIQICFALGQAIGALLWAILPGYRRLARENLRKAFGGEKSPREIRQLTFRHFVTLGANTASAFKTAAMTEAQIRTRTTFENADALRKALDRGKGLVLMISHIGNWELIAQVNFLVRPYKTGTVYQAIRNPHVDELINRDRRKNGVETLDRKKGFPRAMRMLREGHLVGVLVDQHAGDSGIWTPFFDALSSTSPLAASMAVKTGAAVVPMAVQTTGFARWRVVVGEEISYDSDQPEQLTADITRGLEKQIRDSPADWFWVHNRWKIPHPDFLLGRAKRGIYLPKGYDPMRLRPFRILIRSSNWLGDAVMSASAVRAIKHGRPDARITILTRDKLADFWRAVPEVDEVLPVEEKAGVFSVAWRIRGQFDVAVLFPNSARSALEVWLAGIRRRVGYAGHNREWMLNQIVKEPKKRLCPQHHADRYLRIAESLGASTEHFEPEPAPAPEGPIRIGICPGAEYGPAKRWYPIRFRQVMESVSKKVDCTWVIVGVDRDRPLAEDIEAGFDGPLENLCGRTSLRRLIEELKSLHVLVTNDTGTMHLAAFFGIPVVALFGSTEPQLTRPLGSQHIVIRHQVECSPCFLRECPIDFRCMEAITVDEVAEAVLKLLG